MWIAIFFFAIHPYVNSDSPKETPVYLYDYPFNSFICLFQGPPPYNSVYHLNTNTLPFSIATQAIQPDVIR